MKCKCLNKTVVYWPLSCGVVWLVENVGWTFIMMPLNTRIVNSFDCLSRPRSFHCIIRFPSRNGAERSGLLVVLVNVLERCRMDGEVSVPQVIRHIRRRRKQIVPNFVSVLWCISRHVSFCWKRYFGKLCLLIRSSGIFGQGESKHIKYVVWYTIQRNLKLEK